MIAKSSLFALIIALLLSTQCISAQTDDTTVSKLFNSAVSYSEVGDFERAIPLFKKVAEKEPENINVLYNLGHCYLNAKGGHDSALVYFTKAIDILKPENNNKELGIDLHLSMAKSMQMLYQYNEALVVYQKMLGFVDESQTELRTMIDREITICNNGISFMKNPVKLEVQNFGATVNSSYDDHSPLVSADESVVIFTSRRQSPYSQMLADGQYSEKIYSAKKEGETWGQAEVVKEVVKRDSHEAAVCLSADGSELYLLRSDFDGQRLFVSEFDGETWSEPFLLPEGINSRYNETHASINADKSILFFTSDRKGGQGGLDIYMVRKLPNGKWATPRNLGPDINTSYDEETPMIHPNGKTLFFSSEGHNTMGKFDVFYSRMNADSSWSKPVNMGYPINTPDDDFFFVPSAAQNRAYMASSRFDGHHGGSDLYIIAYEEPEADRLAVVKGTLSVGSVGEDFAWDDVVIHVKDKKTDALIGEYKPNPVSGKYMFILEADKTYDVVVEGKNIETTTSSLTVTRDMTYLNQSQSVETDDLMVEELIVEANSDAIADAKGLTDQNTEATGKYTVQFITLKKPLKNYNRYKNLDQTKIMMYKGTDGNYRYVYGSFNTFAEAKNSKQEIIKLTGYNDTFVRYFWQLEKMKSKE